ncbi:hypothetical protein BKA62DRAFT_722300 [Auriculariales sp. MPI-PUGE-AT-0066]|nr:hypothetical protein BKA62DRAFT_722300 [Auriculariales sp. MPI-PUGE-AT-0066]
MSLLAARSAARAVLRVSRIAVPRTLAVTTMRAIPIAAAVTLRELSTSAPPNRVIFIANLPWTVTPTEIATAFYKFGEVEDIKIMADSTGRPRGIGHVTMTNEADAIKAVESLKANPVFFNGRNLRCDFSAAGGDREALNLKPTNNLMMFDFNGDEGAVQAMFTSHLTEVNRIHILRDRETGISRGTVFIEFYTVDSATSAINAVKEQNPNIRIRYAAPRSRDGRDGQRPRFLNQGSDYRGGGSDHRGGGSDYQGGSDYRGGGSDRQGGDSY